MPSSTDEGNLVMPEEPIIYDPPEEPVSLRPEYALERVYSWLRNHNFKGVLPTPEILEKDGIETPGVLSIIAHTYRILTHTDPPPELNLRLLLQGFADPGIMRFVRANTATVCNFDDWRTLAFALNFMMNFADAVDELEVEAKA